VSYPAHRQTDRQNEQRTNGKDHTTPPPPWRSNSSNDSSERHEPTRRHYNAQVLSGCARRAWQITLCPKLTLGLVPGGRSGTLSGRKFCWRSIADCVSELNHVTAAGWHASTRQATLDWYWCSSRSFERTDQILHFLTHKARVSAMCYMSVVIYVITT